MHADVEEADREQNLVLLKRAHVQLLPHRHDEVAIDVRHVPDDGFRVLEEKELELVVVQGPRRVGHDAHDLEDVDLRMSVRARKVGGRTPPRAARSSPRYTVVPTAINSLRPRPVLLDAKLTVFTVEMNSFGRNS